MNNTGKILVALAAGAVAGAVLGVLFAPDKGTTTRRRIVDSSGKLVDSIKETVGGGLDIITTRNVSKAGNGSHR